MHSSTTAWIVPSRREVEAVASAFGDLLNGAVKVSIFYYEDGTPNAWSFGIVDDPNTFGYALESVRGYLRAAAMTGGQLVQLQDGNGGIVAVTDAGVYAIDYDTGVVRVATPEEARGVSVS